MQSCWLISSLPPTRIKCYLLTTFWSPNQYYYRPNIETPRLCHRQSLLARLVTTDNGPAHLLSPAPPPPGPSPQCFIVSVFYVPSTAISYNCSECSGSQSFHGDNSTPDLYFAGPGLCQCHSYNEGRVTGCVRPPVSPRTPTSGDQAPVPPLCQIRPGQGPQWRLAALERVETLQMCGL